MDKNLNIAKRDNDSYSAAFETPEGRLTCVISVARQEGASDRRTPGEKKKEAHKKLQRLAEDFSISLSERAERVDLLYTSQDSPAGRGSLSRQVNYRSRTPTIERGFRNYI